MGAGAGAIDQNLIIVSATVWYSGEREGGGLGHKLGASWSSCIKYIVSEGVTEQMGERKGGVPY